jgi:hypothetical protein
VSEEFEDLDEFTLKPAEKAFLQQLDALGVRFLLVGMGAALLEGAPGTTQDIDLWFGSIDGSKLAEAARKVGGFYSPGVGAYQPPTIGGDGLHRIDLVTTAQGLSTFDEEYARAHTYEIDSVQVRVLPLDRVIASKRASNRAKDAIALPHLEAALAAREDQSRGMKDFDRVIRTPTDNEPER